MDEARIPFSQVRTPSDLFEDPQLNAHGRILPIQMPRGNVAKLPPTPLCFDDEALGLRRQPPRAGEHTDEILRSLGYSDARIALLRKDGVVR